MSEPSGAEPFGDRLAALRVAAGMTQAALAQRVAVSRVTISHVEASLVWPNERTVLLLAGVLGLEPPELVHGTTYPAAKADRIPEIAMRYSQVDLEAALLERDLAWLDRLDEESQRQHIGGVITSWDPIVNQIRERSHDDGAVQRFVAAHGALLDRQARFSGESRA